MRLRLFITVSMVLAVCCALGAQESPASPPAQDQSQNGRDAGRGWGRGMGMGSGVMGTVTEVAADHFTVKKFNGETWTVHFSPNTRVMKQPPRAAREQGQTQGQDRRMGGVQPQAINASEIKVGDAIMAGGELDPNAKSVGAVMIMQLDPERAKQMREMEANYGKTWLMGRVTAIQDTTITVEGGMDHTPHTFVTDENTSFRRRREPITLPDLQVGENVRVEGTVKDGQFVASSVNVMMPPASGGPARRQGPPPQ